MSSEKETRAEIIVNNLSSMIRNHASLVASEQYSPSPSPDTSDDRIREHTQFVKELREIRERFENLITGIILP